MLEVVVVVGRGLFVSANVKSVAAFMELCMVWSWCRYLRRGRTSEATSLLWAIPTS